MPSPDLTRDTLSEVRESTVHPVLPEDTDTVAERRKVGLNHAKGSVDRPEDEEDDEEVVHVPETLKVCATSLFRCRDRNRHQTDQHDITTPTGTSSKVGEDETHEPEIVDGREAGKIVPVSNGVDPGEEDNGPSDKLVEGDVLVKGDYVV